jgi:hypothetical protein
MNTVKHEVTMRVERAAGLIAIGKLLTAGDQVGASVGAEPIEISAVITVRTSIADQAQGLKIAMQAAMVNEPKWGVRALMNALSRKAGELLDGTMPEAAKHAQAVETIKATLASLDRNCRTRAITEWAAAADLAEVALLIGTLQAASIERSIERRVREHMERKERGKA